MMGELVANYVTRRFLRQSGTITSCILFGCLCHGCRSSGSYIAFQCSGRFAFFIALSFFTFSLPAHGEKGNHDHVTSIAHIRV